MNKQPRHEILNLLRLPARLTAEQAAARLGMEPHDIPVLIRLGMLKPLGNPKANSPKRFAAFDIEIHANDSGWLSRATKALSAEHARKKAHRFKSHR